MTTNTDGTLPTGKWEKLADGTFGAKMRTGGRGAEFVGRMVTLVSKAGDFTTVKLVALVEDYGDGDVAIYTVSR